MHCTNPLRKTTLTLLDTRKLRLHSTLLDHGVSITSSSRQHASLRLLLFLRASIYHGNIGEGIHDLRQHIWIFHLSLSTQRRRNLTANYKKGSSLFAINYLPHEARYDSGESVTVWVFYLNYWAIFDTAKGVSLWLHERTCLNLSFQKSALTDGEGWKSGSGVYSGSAEWADDNGRYQFLLSLPWSRARPLIFTPFTYLGVVDRILARETQDGKILLVGLVQCNCDMLELLFLVHAIYLLSLDLVATVFTVAPSTESIFCYFNLCSGFILLCTIWTWAISQTTHCCTTFVAVVPLIE